MKLKSLKKPAALLLAMALSVSALTGCSGGTESSSGSSFFLWRCHQQHRFHRRNLWLRAPL